MISILTWKNCDNKTTNINVKNCRFNAGVTMTLIKRRNGKNSFTVFSHAKISWHHYYVIIFWHSVMMTTTVFYFNICCFIITVLSGQDWYHSINQPQNYLLDERISEISYTCCLFCVKFRCHGKEFVWQHSIALPRKPPAVCKNVGDIFRKSRVIAYFVLNFRCHGNRGWSW